MKFYFLVLIMLLNFQSALADIEIGNVYRTQKTIKINKVFLFFNMSHTLYERQDIKIIDIVQSKPKKYKIQLLPAKSFTLSSFLVDEADLNNTEKFEDITLKPLQPTSWTKIINNLNHNSADYNCEGDCDSGNILKMVRPPTPIKIITPNSAIEGAHRVMSALYQDCSVLNKAISATDVLSIGGKPTTKCPRCNGMSRVRGLRLLDKKNIDTYIKKHFYLSDLLEKRNQDEYPALNCKDILQTPPAYAFSADCKVDGGELKILRDLSKKDLVAHTGVSTKSSPLVGFDCAEFIGASLAAAGLKILPTRSTSEPGTSTIELYTLTNQKKNNTCFKTIDFVPDTIQPGDLVVVKNNHVVMIDSVGPDPFGIDKTLKEGRSCKSLTVADFDFTYIHSGDLGGSLGVSRVQASFHSTRGNGMSLTSNLLSTARKMCEAKFLEKNNKIKKSTKINHFSVKTSAFNHPTVVLRHLGNEKSGCTIPNGERLKIEGESCVQSCI